jgi:hypothetical protein
LPEVFRNQAIEDDIDNSPQSTPGWVPFLCNVDHSAAIADGELRFWLLSTAISSITMMIGSGANGAYHLKSGSCLA